MTANTGTPPTIRLATTPVGNPQQFDAPCPECGFEADWSAQRVQNNRTNAITVQYTINTERCHSEP